MQFDSSLKPGATGTDSLARPGFDIILAVSSARQAVTPTALYLQAWETARSSRVLPAARRSLLSGHCATGSKAVGLARFCELQNSDAEAPQNMNVSFTREFQPMFKTLPVHPDLGGQPDRSDEENMD